MAPPGFCRLAQHLMSMTYEFSSKNVPRRGVPLFLVYKMLFLGYNIPRRWCLFWDTKNFFLGYKIFFWNAKNFFWDTKNFFGDTQTFGGIQKTFFWIQNAFFGIQRSAKVVLILGYNFFFGIQKLFWDTKNFFGDTKNFFWDTQTFLGYKNFFLGYQIQKLFSGYKMLFRDTKNFGKQKYLVDQNPRTSHKLQKTKIIFLNKIRKRIRKSKRFF